MSYFPDSPSQNLHAFAFSHRRAGHGHKPAVIWMTGISASGKSTIADALDSALQAQGRTTAIIDGDSVRGGLCRDLGFTDSDRDENIRRVAEVARLMMEAGLMVIVALISPSSPVGITPVRSSAMSFLWKCMWMRHWKSPNNVTRRACIKKPARG